MSAIEFEAGQTVTAPGNDGQFVKNGYYFNGWNTQANGSGTAYTQGQTFTIGTANVTLYAKWSTVYNIGDTGPGGGLIFYDKGSFSDGWRYLEAAPASTEWASVKWGGYGTVTGATAKAIGTGEANTTVIVGVLNGLNETGCAAQLCDSLVEGGCSNWFLPSQDELNLMNTNLHQNGAGGFTDSVHYWSSSEGRADASWSQFFGSGSTGTYSKNGTIRARAIRAF
ncbi:MAG: hypothetical protein GY754_12205 [bacterium]|nr:hypothetical protein [bacterium]